MISAPAADRNKEPILNVLKQLLSDSVPLKALEIASGTGQHIVHFAQHFKNINWTPSDVDKRYFGSVTAHAANAQITNVQEPQLVDVTWPIDKWPEVINSTKFDVIYCANMIHISPYATTTGLFAAAGKLLKSSSGLLITYGPYAQGGILTPESNVRFNESLCEQNPEWGIRDIDDILKVAAENGLTLIQKIDMPANNKTLVFQKN